MASSNWTMVRSPLTPAVDKGNLSPIKRSVLVASKIKTTVVPLQVKCEKGHISSSTKTSASRRDMMQCLTTGVLGLALLPKPAEARIGRLEMKKLIIEKLEELKEKAALSKPKTKNEIKPPTKPSPGENGIKPPIKQSQEDKKSPTSPPSPPLKPMVETALSNIAPANDAL